MRSAPTLERRLGRTLVSALIGCVLWSWAGTALAQSSERIRFDFTGGSFISLLGGTIVTPPDGTLDTGAATVWVEATAPGAYVASGQVILGGVNVAGTVAKNVFGSADVSGPYLASQTAPLAGTLAAGMDGADFVDDLSLFVDAQLDCTGSGCSAIGFPVSVSGVSLLAVTFLPITDLGVVGGASINATVPIELDGVLGELNLVGVEVSRTFIPEPGTFLLVSVGLGLMAAGRRRAGR